MKAFGILVAISLFVAPAVQAATIISPPYAQMQPNQTMQFSASGIVIWQVDNITGGGAGGSITPSGLFTAPASLPSPAAVTVTAVSAANPSDSATATVTLLAQAPAGTTYYVAPDGSDKNPGTLGAPFATLQHAATVAAAGDTVIARQGIYNALLTPPHNGNGTQGPITFMSYPGESATIDGTGLKIPGGQNGLITLHDVSDVIIEGFELRNYTTKSTKQVPVGIYIDGAGDGVQLVNNHIHDIITSAKTTPKKCGSDALGLAVYGTQAPAAITGLVISGNELDHLQTGCSESMSIDGNVDGYAVLSNIVHDNNNIGIDSIGFERVSKDPAYDQARNGEIRGNLVYNITSYGNPDYGKQYAADGIYVDGGTQIVIEQNEIHDTDLAVEMASEHNGHVTSYITARNNVIYHNNSNGISIGGYAKSKGGTDHCTIVNNTLFDNDTQSTGSGEFQIQWNATHNLFANNILYAGPQNLFVNNYPPYNAEPAQLDYNIYYSTSGADLALFHWKKTHYTGFATYQAATGQDSHSLFADPLFISVAADDLDLQSGSPAFGAGFDYGADTLGAADYAGNPRIVAGKVTTGAYQK